MAFAHGVEMREIDLKVALEFNKLTTTLCATGVGLLYALSKDDKLSAICYKFAVSFGIAMLSLGFVFGLLIVGRASRLRPPPGLDSVLRTADSQLLWLGKIHSAFLALGLIVVSLLIAVQIWD